MIDIFYPISYYLANDLMVLINFFLFLSLILALLYMIWYN